MPPDVKWITFANMNVKLCSGTITFHKVVEQQISGEVVGSISTSSAYPF